MRQPWIDISQALTNDMAHWPGDTPFTRELTFSKAETGSVNIGQITTSLHTGTHVDAPFHFDNDGKTIEQLDINDFIGKARVFDICEAEEINVEVLKQFTWENVTRALFRTSFIDNLKQFPETIPTIDPAIAPFLASKGVKLFGIDLPSVDALDSKTLETHHAFAEHGIHILENIVLSDIQPGVYELIALPLAIHGADGSPVRAVIRKIKEEKQLG